MITGYWQRRSLFRDRDVPRGTLCQLANHRM